MRRSTASGGRALACIALLVFAQFVTPGLAQFAPAGTAIDATTQPQPGAMPLPGSASAQLQLGAMPFTQDQLGCFVTAAAGSAAVQTYFDVSAVLGLAAVYGNASDSAGAKLMEELTASPEVEALLALPLKNVTAAYEAWMQETMDACGMPPLMDSSGTELTSDQVMAWFSSMQTTDMLAGIGFDMTPTADDEALAAEDFTARLTAAGMSGDVRRRLLVWATLRVWAAKASGAAYGLGTSILAHSAGGVAKTAIMTVVAGLGAPVGLTMMAGMMAYGVATRVVKKQADAAAAPLVSLVTDDPKVKDAFTGSVQYGTQAHAILTSGGITSPKDFTAAKLTRLVEKADLKGKALEWVGREARVQAELTWAEANKDNPAVAELLPKLWAAAGAIHRLAAKDADVSRANWKVVAKEVVTEAIVEAGLDPANVITGVLAAALEPTPGVEPTGDLTADTADLVDLAPPDYTESTPAWGFTEELLEGAGGDSSAPDDGSGDDSSTLADDGATADEGGNTADDSGAQTDDSTAADKGGNTADDSGADDEGATNNDDGTDGGSTADDGGDGSDAWADSTAGDAGAGEDAGGWTGSSADDA